MPDISIEFPPFHGAQKEIFESEARFKVVAGGRQVGKTSLGVIICMRSALEGGRTWWVAPSLGNANEGWQKLTAFASAIPGTKTLLGERTVIFPSGGSVRIRTASEPSRLRGASLDGVVLDEASFMKEEAWTHALQPTLAARKGWALFISTPNGKNNWFYELFEAANGIDGWKRWQIPTKENPRIAQDELDRAEKILPPATFAQEYLGAFTVPGGQVFRVEWLRYYEATERFYALGERAQEKTDCWKFITVDLAASTKESADYTCMGVWAVSPRSDLILLDVVWERLEAPDIVPKMQELYDRFLPGFIGVEKNGLGLPIVQYAIRAGLPIKPIDAGKNDIQSRAMPAAARMEAGMMWLPRNAPWLSGAERELLAFPSGQHDDFISMWSYGAIEIAGTRLFDVGNLVESERFDFGLAEKDLGLVTNTNHDDLIETEDYEAWVPEAEEEWR